LIQVFRIYSLRTLIRGSPGRMEPGHKTRVIIHCKNYSFKEAKVKVNEVFITQNHPATPVWAETMRLRTARPGFVGSPKPRTILGRSPCLLQRWPKCRLFGFRTASLAVGKTFCWWRVYSQTRFSACRQVQVHSHPLRWRAPRIKIIPGFKIQGSGSGSLAPRPLTIIRINNAFACTGVETSSQSTWAGPNPLFESGCRL